MDQVEIEAPEDRLYTPDHEWARKRRQTVLVGVTPFAVAQMGKLDCVRFSVGRGDLVKAGQIYANVDVRKFTFDVLSPVSGRVVQVHRALCEQPEPLALDAYGKGWLMYVRPEDPRKLAREWSRLVDAAAYREAARISEPLKDGDPDEEWRARKAAEAAARAAQSKA